MKQGTKVLLVGGGGREHALAWRLAQSERCATLYCAPGNAGIAECAECVAITATNLEALVSFAQDKEIDLVVIGPEAPLVAGLADRLRAAGIAVFGPSQAAAALEGSKGFMKDLCRRHNIPTAAYGRFDDVASAASFIRARGTPIVIKADGLAAGKGVVIAQTEDEAMRAVRDMLSGDAFGAAGKSVVIEEFLKGEEISYFTLADGKTFVPFGTARDHKRAFDGDKGPNTGGMGVVSPAPGMTDELAKKIEERIIQPAINGMSAAGCPFTGVLFAGVMIVEGEPILLEFNTRFGDPECQTLMMRLQGDLLEILDAAAHGTLAQAQEHIAWCNDTVVCVVMAANGYPGAYIRGAEIAYITEANNMPGVKVFHAATRPGRGQAVLSDGGRVLGVTAQGETLDQARRRAYGAVDTIRWPEGFCRRDIGLTGQQKA